MTTCHDDALHRRASHKLERLRFLELTPAARQDARRRAQRILDQQSARHQQRPSALRRALEAGAYDPPKPGEYEALCAWRDGQLR
jgi:hypothetical protein